MTPKPHLGKSVAFSSLSKTVCLVKFLLESTKRTEKLFFSGHRISFKIYRQNTIYTHEMNLTLDSNKCPHHTLNPLLQQQSIVRISKLWQMGINKIQNFKQHPCEELPKLQLLHALSTEKQTLNVCVLAFSWPTPKAYILQDFTQFSLSISSTSTCVLYFFLLKKDYTCFYQLSNTNSFIKTIKKFTCKHITITPNSFILCLYYLYLYKFVYLYIFITYNIYIYINGNSLVHTSRSTLPRSERKVKL